jgi:secondary thiamine-phosphate synthase enzyme
VRQLTLRTGSRTQLLDITAEVNAALECAEGTLVTLFVPHTTAGIVVQASGPNATKVASDIEHALEQIVDESWSWEHTSEGDKNPWSHVRSALTASSLSIPFVDGKLALGNLQAIFFCEFDGPRDRTVLLTVT